MTIIISRLAFAIACAACLIACDVAPEATEQDSSFSCSQLPEQVLELEVGDNFYDDPYLNHFFSQHDPIITFPGSHELCRERYELQEWDEAEERYCYNYNVTLKCNSGIVTGVAEGLLE